MVRHGGDLQKRLTPAERTDLEWFEGVVDAGMQTFVEVGQALMAIRERRLYRESHGTFEDYTRERWGFHASRARQLIAAAELTTVTGVTPANESQSRALIPLLRDEGPDAVVEVWRDLEHRHPGRVTAPLIRHAVAEKLERDQRAIERDERARLADERNRQIAEDLARQIPLLEMPQRPLDPGDPVFWAFDRPVSSAGEIAQSMIAEGLVNTRVLAQFERVAAFTAALAAAVREAGIE